MEYVLVTGYAGYIGSHVCKKLKQQGYSVIGVDQTEPDRWDAFEKYVDRQCEWDYSDSRTFYALTRFNIKTVIHTAATSLVGPSIADPETYYENNVSAMKIFLENCRRAGVERIVYSSSAAVYGDGHAVFDESLAPAPISPYGKTKLIGEWMLEDYCRAYGISAVALRYFNVCGADRDGEFGQTGKPSHILPVALNRAMQSEELVINGKDYNTKDGTCERDYVHVEDVAQANVQACSADIPGFVAVNIGNSVGYSNLQIADAVNQYTKYQLNYSFGDARPGDPEKLISNNNRAKLLLNWQPQHSDLKNIIQTAEQWHENNESSQ